MLKYVMLRQVYMLLAHTVTSSPGYVSEPDDCDLVYLCFSN